MEKKQDLTKVGDKIKNALLNSGMTPEEVENFLRDYKPPPDYTFDNSFYSVWLFIKRKLVKLFKKLF